MTQPFNPAGDGQPAVPAPDATAAGSRAAGGRSRRAAEHLARPARPGIRDGQPCGGPVTAAAARRVIDAFSRPRRPGGRRRRRAAVAAAAAAGRRVLALAPARPGAAAGPAALPPPARGRGGGAGRSRRPVGWRGPGCLAGQRPGRARARVAYAAGERALRPGGILAVIAGPAAPGGTLAGTAGSIVAAARAAGLVYAQHIVLVHAAVDGDRLSPADPAPGPAAPGGSPRPRRPARVHQARREAR